MGRVILIFNTLAAGAFCLLVYAGIFSGLSNNSRQGLASISFTFFIQIPSSTIEHLGWEFYLDHPLLKSRRYASDLSSQLKTNPFFV